VLSRLASPSDADFYAQGIAQGVGYFGYFAAALGFRYYPAPPGRYSVSVECVNFLASGATLSAGPIEIRLK
jgi:hypothetical protein